MTTSYPGSIQTLSGTRGTSGQPLNAPNHVTQHTYEDDTIEALEAKVGADSSAVTSSHDYKLSEVLTSTPDKAVGKSATQTLTNKTLTSPKITAGSMSKGDMFQLSASDGTLIPLRASADANIISWNNSTQQWEAIANPAASDASTTVKGVVEEATQAEVDAGTASGGTSARLFQNPSTIRARLLNTGVVDTGSSTAYAIAPSPAITAYAAYQEFTFKAVNANTTTTPTLAVNGLTAKTLVLPNGTAPQVGQITAGSIIQVVYDGTNMVIVSGLRSKIPYNATGTKNANDASTTQTFAHGLGEIPKSCSITAQYAAAGSAIINTAFTRYNGTTQSSISICGETTARTMTTDFRLSIMNSGNGNNIGVVSFDATNITITWTKSNTSDSAVYNLLVEAIPF